MRRPGRKTEIHREVTEGDHILREPLPSSRAILWKPLPDSYHLLAAMMRAPEQQASLFITQRAFLQVERHLRSGPDLELGGFLAGQVGECPRTRMGYAIVNTVVPFADVSEDPIGSRVTQEAFDTVRKRLIRHRLSLIGWYRNGNGLGLQLLPDDVETHMTYFGEPWQTTMLVVQTGSTSKGAFFTYDPRVGRSYCIPFYELFDTGAPEVKRLDRTCVNWATYLSAVPVQPLEGTKKEIVETTVAPMRPAPPEPEPPEPIDEWWDAIKDPWVKLKDVTVRPTRRDEPSPLVWEPQARPSDAEPKQREPKTWPAPVQERPTPVRASQQVEAPPAPAAAKPVEAPPLPAAAKPIEAPPPTPVTRRAVSGRPEPVRPAPPFVGPARPVSRVPTPVHVEPVARAMERPTPRETAVAPAPVAAPPRPQPRRSPPTPRPIPPATVEATLRAAGAPAVALPPGFHDEAIGWQRRRRIGLAVAAASFLSVIVLSTIRPRISGSAQAPPAVTIAAPVPVTQLTASVNGDVVLALPVAVDSLSGALSFYREMEADHRGGMVGCRLLNRAYQLVGQARTRVDSARSRIAGALDAADSIRVSMLRAEYTHVAQTYQRSGCAS